jgi:hypothetical protein
MLDSKQKHLYDYFIDERGNWFCEGNPVVDQQLFQMLSRSLFERAGSYFIRCEGEVHPVRVADAPVWIRYVHVRTDSDGNPASVELELQDGRRETLAAETLTTGGNDGLYCLATPRGLRARFSKIAYYELTRYLQMDENGMVFFLVIDGRRYDIGVEPGEDRSFHDS